MGSTATRSASGCTMSTTQTLKRTPKLSASFYKKLIARNALV